MTTQECGACHDQNTWLPVRFSHSAPAYPGDHGPQVDCTGCHRQNNQTVSFPSPAFKPDCAACHAGDFAPRKHEKVRNESFYSVTELSDCTGACHIYATENTSREKDDDDDDDFEDRTRIVEFRSRFHQVGNGQW